MRQWSFKDRGNADTVCVLKKGDPVAHAKHVKNFTAEKNLFDTTVHDEGFERFFDEKCKYVESNYPRLLSALSTNTYDGQARIYLTEFMSNLFVRQRKTFEFLMSIIEQKHLRVKFLNEIAMLEKDEDHSLIKGVYEEVAIDSDHTVESKVSAVILQAWKHFKEVLSRFDHVLIKAPPDRSWFTSDNPIITVNFGKDAWFVGPDAEMYFPISKEYLVYMFFNGLGTNSMLRTMPLDIPTEVSCEIFDNVMHSVIKESKPDYFILGEDLCLLNMETGEYQKSYRPVDRSEPHEYRTKVALMDTPTPPNLDDKNLEKLLTKLDAEFEPIILQVETHQDAIENECIAIVDRMMSENGGKRILGWQIWQGPYIMEAEFHAVWETLEGVLKDVSFKKVKVKDIVFVEDERLTYEGKQINNVRLNLLEISLVDDFIEACNQQFRLLNKGKRGLLYGKELADHLTTDQLNNIGHVNHVKSLILKLLNSGGDKNSPCPCNERRKYKNCHGELVTKLKRLD